METEGWAYSYTAAMCTDKDLPRCEHDDLIAQVDRLQDQVGRLMATNEELRRQLAAAQRAMQASGCAVLQRRADLKAQASGSKAELAGVGGGCTGPRFSYEDRSEARAGRKYSRGNAPRFDVRTVQMTDLTAIDGVTW